LVQQARRDGGLDVTDRIHLRIELPEPQQAMVRAHEDHLAQSVLATSITYANSGEVPGEASGEGSAPLDGATVTWSLRRA